MQELLYERPITLAHRETVELEADDILAAAYTCLLYTSDAADE